MAAHASRSSRLHTDPVLRAINHRAQVDQAKGVLILLYRIDAVQAFAVLRSWASETGTTVVTVARTLLHAVCLEDDSKEWDNEVRAHVERAIGSLDGYRAHLPDSHPPAPRLRVVR
jgi:hypothetical protein